MISQAGFQNDHAFGNGWLAAVVAAIGMALLAVDIVDHRDQPRNAGIGAQTNEIVSEAGAIIVPTEW